MLKVHLDDRQGDGIINIIIIIIIIVVVVNL
jgi:hypothetical protein